MTSTRSQDTPATPARFVCRDIGYGIEEGEYLPTPLDVADWVGKRPYATPDGSIVYLFDDELGQ